MVTSISHHRSLDPVFQARINRTIDKEVKKAVELFSVVVADKFEQAVHDLQRALNRSNLGDPVRSLARELLNRTDDFAADGDMERLLAKVLKSILKVNVDGVGDVSLPAINSGRRQESISRNDPYYEPFDKVTSPSRHDRTDRTDRTNKKGDHKSDSSASTGASDGPDRPPAPLEGKDAQSIDKQNKFNADMFAYQQRLSAMQLYWQMMSTIQKSADDTKRALIQNLR